MLSEAGVSGMELSLRSGPGGKVKALHLRRRAGRERMVVCGKLRRNLRRDGRNVSANLRSLLAQRDGGAVVVCWMCRSHLWRQFISPFRMLLIHGRLIHQQIEFCPLSR